jgi:purine catabolism regulator
MRSGIGLPAGEISLWRDSFRQAGQALEMARRLGSREPQYYPDLSVYRLLLQLEHHPDLHTFRSEILGSLLSYEGGGDLLKTLEAYFEHNGNLSQAAEALYIHRNTLTYRMERIAEISGLDLDHNETRLAVQLALRIHRMLESND